MNCEVSFTSMMTTKKLGAALLLGCALGASGLAMAAGQAASADAKGAAPTRNSQQAQETGPLASQTQAPSPVRGNASGGQSAQVKALQKQLKDVQTQLLELAEQNRALLEH